MTPRQLVTASRGDHQLIISGALATGAAVGLLATRLDGFELLAFTYFAAIGVVLSTVDLLEHRLPGQVSILGLGSFTGLLTVLAVIESRADDLVRAICAATILTAAYLVLALTSRGGLGAGDVKIAGLLGMATGWHTWTTILIATLAGWTAALAVLILDGRRNKPDRVTMGPFLFASALLGIVQAPA